MTLNYTDMLSSPQAACDEKRFKETSIAEAIINVPLCLTALLGNAAVLFAMSKTDNFHSPAKIFLASLAVSDLAVGLIACPLFVSCNVLASIYGFSIFDRPIWKVFSILAYLLCIVSFLNVTTISVDRLLALRLHLRYNMVVTPRRSVVVVGVIWLTSALVSGMRQWNANLFYSTLALAIVACLAVTFIAYVNVYRIVRRHQAQIRSHEQQASHICGNRLRLTRLKNSALNTFYLCVLFLVCYVPYLSVIVAALIMERRLLIVFSVATTIALLNSSLNPLLYCWRLREIRQIITQRVAELCAKQLGQELDD